MTSSGPDKKVPEVFGAPDWPSSSSVWQVMAKNRHFWPNSNI